MKLSTEVKVCASCGKTSSKKDRDICKACGGREWVIINCGQAANKGAVEKSPRNARADRPPIPRASSAEQERRNVNYDRKKSNSSSSAAPKIDAPAGGLENLRKARSVKGEASTVKEAMADLKRTLVSEGSFRAMSTSDTFDNLNDTTNSSQSRPSSRKSRTSFKMMRTLSLEEKKKKKRNRKRHWAKVRSATVVVASSLKGLRENVNNDNEFDDDGSSSDYSFDGEEENDWLNEEEEEEDKIEVAVSSDKSFGKRKSVGYFDQFPKEIRDAVLNAVETIEFKASENIVRQGDDGDTMYVILQGEAAIFVIDEETKKERPITHIYAGDYFGETSLIYGVKRTATVRAVDSVKCCVLSRAKYLTMPHFRSFLTLSKCDLTKDLNRDAKLALCKCMRAVEYRKGDFVIREGDYVEDDANAFFMITKGEVEVFDSSDGHLVNLRVGHSFGETALVRHAPRNASVRVLSKLLTCVALCKRDFEKISSGAGKSLSEKLVANTERIEMVRTLRHSVRVSQLDILEQAKECMADEDDEAVLSPHLFRKRSESYVADLKPRSPKKLRGEVNEYKILRTLGRGSFAEVKLVEHKTSKVQFAMKSINCKRLRRNSVSKFNDDNIASLMLEVKIMKLLHHKHIVVLHEVIDDRKAGFLYLVQELCTGGTLMPDAENKDGARPLQGKTARLYTRQIIRALEYMHRCGVIHRDLKPQNILLNESKDQLKLCDFGTACIINTGETLTVPKGTPAFMAPEILLEETVRYSGPPADIWSLGATLYMMVTGRQPWQAADYMRLSHKVRHDELTFPKTSTIDPHLRDLLVRILTKDPKRRPPLQKLMCHEWITNEGCEPMLPLWGS